MYICNIKHNVMNELIEVDGLLRDSKLPKNHADDNHIIPFKGRTIDADKVIAVYRNLNRKGKWYSIRQGSLVVGHTTAICIRDVKFIVRDSGRQRAISVMQRNVHAYIEGKYATSGMGVSASPKGRPLPARIQYHPYNKLRFFCDNLTSNTFEVKGADFCVVNETGVSAGHTYEF